MKFCIFTLLFSFSTVTFADDNTICLTKNSAQLFLESDRAAYSLRTSDTELEIISPNNPERIWKYKFTGQVVASEDSKLLCRKLMEDFSKARIAAAMEGLKSNSSLALALLLPIGLAPVNPADCQLIGAQKIYELLPTNGKQSSPMGSRVGIYQNNPDLFLIEHLRGLIYQNQGCRRIRLHK